MATITITKYRIYTIDGYYETRDLAEAEGLGTFVTLTEEIDDSFSPIVAE